MPKLRPENRLPWFLFQRVLPGLFNGMGGVNYQAIDSVFANYGIRYEVRPLLFDGLIVMIEAIMELRRQKRDGQ